MSVILSLDQQLFLWMYQLPHGVIFNAAARFFSLIGTAGIVWFVLGVLLFIREERKHHRFFIPIAAAGIASWLAVEWILKPLIARPRPTDILTDFSFPSGHVTIAFSMVVVLSRYEPRWKWGFFILAILISLSRVYLGVHYPLDVIGGAFLGLGIGHTVRRFVVL